MRYPVLRNSIVFPLVSLLLVCSCSTPRSDAPGSAVYQPDTVAVNEWDLDSAAYAAWRQEIQNFGDSVYAPYFNDLGIAFDCSTCEHLSMDAVITIGTTGMVTYSHITPNKVNCVRLTTAQVEEAFRKFREYFINHKFPAILHLRKIRFTIQPNRILKC